MNIRIHTCVFFYMQMCTYIYLYIYMYVYHHLHVHIYIYVYICIYIYTRMWAAWHACVPVGDLCAFAKIHYCALGERASGCSYEYIFMCFVNFELSQIMFACMYVCIYIYRYIYRFRYM